MPPGRELVGDRVDVLHLPRAREAWVSVNPVFESTLHVDRGSNIVPTSKILQRLRYVIAVLAVPEMLVRIDDEPRGFDHRLIPERKPLLVDKIARRSAAQLLWNTHDSIPSIS
jgi:hypothetical protein